MSTHGTLRWRLVRRLVALQLALLTAVLLGLLALWWWHGDRSSLETEDRVLEVLSHAVVRAPDGTLALHTTPALAQLRADVPGLWFSIHDLQGHWLSEGRIPPEYARIGSALDAVGQARLGWNLGDPVRPTARIKRMETAAGNVQIMTGPGGALSTHQLIRIVLLLLATVGLPAAAVMGLITLFATPWVVRRAMRGLDRAAADATRIDVHQRGVRLPAEQVPAEAKPLVDAINAALARLDEGYARQQRFLLDAAHELRTPIAILQARLDGSDESPQRTQLLEDVARLTTLAEQMLDAERLRQPDMPLTPVDLVALARRVAADLAPLAIPAGYELALRVHIDGPATVMGDAPSLERAVTNLVQNAIQHGGRCGCISLRVQPPRVMEVADQGQGIPTEDRERIFEPFHRLRAQSGGTGLGLHLVHEIVRRHSAHISVCDEPGGGTCFRIEFPSPETTPHALAGQVRDSSVADA